MPAVAAALSAYPWCRGALVRFGQAWRGGPPRYCAVGALLRYAEVSVFEIAQADRLSAIDFWDTWGELLGREYGIPGLPNVHRIVCLNDFANSPAQASEWIVRRLGKTDPMCEMLTPAQLDLFGTHGVEISSEAILRFNGWSEPATVPLRISRWLRERRSF